MLSRQAEVSFPKYLRIASALLQASVVAVACWSLSPINTGTMLAAASEYVRATGFGPYDRLVYSHVQRRPFEVCAGADERHSLLLTRLADELPAINASSAYEPVRLFRLIRAFNQTTQTFYAAQCPTQWTYSYSYVDYQSGLMKVGPALWVVDALSRSEIYIIVLLALGSWFGIFCLFWLTKKLTGSVLVGLASLGALWFSLSFFGPMLHADFRLNLLNTFALAGVAVFLCELPRQTHWLRTCLVEVPAALVFAIYAMLLTFLRLPSTRIDATVVLAMLFVVALVRWSPDVLRRAVLVLVLVTAVQWPYQQYSATLLGPVQAVNTANADEYKTVNAVQFLTERPGHFGNFILDFNFTWIFDADYYLRQLTPVQALHHGYPAWGREFLLETVLEHPTEFPNAWWRRFLIQIVYHKPMSYGIYKAHDTAGTAVIWLSVPLIFFLLSRWRPLVSTWPLLGLVGWEVFGLHTFLGLMHVHPIYLLKGVPLLWCTLPTVVYLAGREGLVLAKAARSWSWPARPTGRVLAVTVAASLAVAVVGWLGVRGYRKEVHATNIWRAVHAGQYYQDAYLSPEDLVKEVEAIRALGGDEPGTVSMYGAWALFGYQERIAAYTQFAGQPIAPERVRGPQMELFYRALAEAPENPHFYPYARYFVAPDRLQLFKTALDRFPEHPYAVMMSYFVGAEDPGLSFDERVAYYGRYESAVHRQLRESASFRPGFRELPSVAAPGPVVPTADGMFTTLLPGEVAKVEPFQTHGTDRLAVGVYLKVTEGQVSVQLDHQPKAKLFESPVVTNSATVAYRAWHFTDLEADRQSSRTATTGLVLQAGPQGARFTIRDLYPLVENPRWFR